MTYNLEQSEYIAVKKIDNTAFVCDWHTYILPFRYSLTPSIRSWTSGKAQSHGALICKRMLIRRLLTSGVRETRAKAEHWNFPLCW